MKKKKHKIYSTEDTNKVELSNEQWKAILSPEVYYIAREKGTERPYTGKYLKNEEKGVYHCIACGYALFLSDTKFESHCGWPSFFKPYSNKNLRYVQDSSHDMMRTEILCGRCGAHLGHVFEDGPEPTGLRYCINSAVLKFEKEKK